MERRILTRRAARESNGAAPAVPGTLPQPARRRAGEVAAPRAVRVPLARGERASERLLRPKRALPPIDSVNSSAARESLLSARGTEPRPVRPRRGAASRSPSRSCSPPTALKFARPEGALTRSAAARRCWFDLLPDDLLALKILAGFETRHLLYLRLVSRKFRAATLFVPAVVLQPVRRRLGFDRLSHILKLYPMAQLISLPSCLDARADGLAAICDRDAAAVRSLVLRGNSFCAEHVALLGRWLARADSLELKLLDLSENQLCVARGASSLIDVSGLRELLAPFAHGRPAGRRLGGGSRSPARSPVRSPARSPAMMSERSSEPSAASAPPSTRAAALPAGACVLRELNLSHNQLCATGAAGLSASLLASRALKCTQSGLRTLRLSHCLLGEAGVRDLVPALRTLGALSCLELTSNFAYDAGAIAIAEWLGTAAPRLQALALGFNGIGDEGAEALAHAIELKQQAASRAVRAGRHEGTQPLRTVELGGNVWSAESKALLERVGNGNGVDILLRDVRPFTLTTER